MLQKKMAFILGAAIVLAGLTYVYLPHSAPAPSKKAVAPAPAAQEENRRKADCLLSKQAYERNKATESSWIKKAQASKKQPVLLAVVYKNCVHCEDWKKEVYRQYGDLCSLAFFHEAVGGDLPLPDIQQIEISDHQDWATKLKIRRTPFFIVNDQQVDFKKENASDQVMKDRLEFYSYRSSKQFYKDFAQQVSLFYRNLDESNRSLQD